MTKEKAALQGGLSKSSSVIKSNKESIILKELCHRAIHRFDAEQLGDHCLNSTIATLRGKGIDIAQERVKVPTRFGKEVSVCRYWVPPESIIRAVNFLRGAP